MTDARVDRVEPDVWAARAFLEQAQRLLQDGAEERISPEGRQILLHGAVVAGCDAILAVNGRQIVGSDGGHRLRLATAQSLLPRTWTNCSSALTTRGWTETKPPMRQHSCQQTWSRRHCQQSASWSDLPTLMFPRNSHRIYRLRASDDRPLLSGLVAPRIVGPFDFAEGNLVEMEWAAVDGSVRRRFTSPPLTTSTFQQTLRRSRAGPSARLF